MNIKRGLLIKLILWGIAGVISLYIMMQSIIAFYLTNRDYNSVLQIIDKHQEFINLTVENHGSKGVIVTGGLPNKNLINQFKLLVTEMNCSHVIFNIYIISEKKKVMEMIKRQRRLSGSEYQEKCKDKF